MAHRFTAEWSCFIIDFDDEGGYHHELRYIGRMYLVFKPNGELYRGTLEYEGEEPLNLRGSASIGVGERTIRLDSDADDFFEGILTWESDDLSSMAVNGKVHFPGESRLKKRLLDAGILSQKAQDDPPWVITKP